MTFLLVDRFAAMPLVSAIEALRAANAIAGFKAYEWQIISHDGDPVMASNGMSMAAQGDFAAGLGANYLFVVASLDYDPPYRSALNAFLRQCARGGARIGALSLGTWILARAGLLENAKCTIHWEGLPAFRETFPDINVVNELYVIDKDRYTASGGLAGMDMMLAIISAEHSPDLAIKIANNFQLERIRNSTSLQRSGNVIRMDTMPKAIQMAVEIMMANLENPLPNSKIAKRINTSVRNLERNFMRKLNTSPAKYYMSLRLEKARELLTYTNLSTLEIALQCGFSSSSYFARCFQHQFGKRPSEFRKS